MCDGQKNRHTEKTAVAYTALVCNATRRRSPSIDVVDTTLAYAQLVILSRVSTKSNTDAVYTAQQDVNTLSTALKIYIKIREN